MKPKTRCICPSAVLIRVGKFRKAIKGLHRNFSDPQPSTLTLDPLSKRPRYRTSLTRTSAYGRLSPVSDPRIDDRTTDRTTRRLYQYILDRKRRAELRRLIGLENSLCALSIDVNLENVKDGVRMAGVVGRLLQLYRSDEGARTENGVDAGDGTNAEDGAEKSDGLQVFESDDITKLGNGANLPAGEPDPDRLDPDQDSESQDSTKAVSGLPDPHPPSGRDRRLASHASICSVSTLTCSCNANNTGFIDW